MPRAGPPRLLTTKRLIQKGFEDVAHQVRTNYPRSSWQVYIRDTAETRMSGASMTKLPIWSTRMSTARSRLPPTASESEVQALSDTIDIGFTYAAQTLDGDSCLLSVAQGRFSHHALVEQLGTLSPDYTAHTFAVTISIQRYHHWE